MKKFVAHGETLLVESDEEKVPVEFDTNPDWYPHLAQPKPVEPAETDLDETPKKDNDNIPPSDDLADVSKIPPSQPRSDDLADVSEARP